MSAVGTSGTMRRGLRVCADLVSGAGDARAAHGSADCHGDAVGTGSHQRRYADPDS
jgi:hypothetical protein